MSITPALTLRPLAGTVSALGVALNNIRDNRGARKKKRRKGRGQGSTKGGKSGRGNKGHKSRSGGGVRPGFEGANYPLYKSVRKFGFTNAKFKREYQIVNLDRLQYWIDSGRINPKERITLKTLLESGCSGRIRKREVGIKLLAGGKEEFHAKGLQIEVSQVSAEAKRIIESQGGTVLTVYFSRVGLRNFLKAPDEEDVPIRFARAPPKLATRYDMPRYIPAHKRHVLDTSWSPQTQHMNFFSSEPLPGELDPHTYTLLAEQTLNEIEDEVEELLEDSALEDYDIHNQDGVLTINLGSRGTYVINKQTPNKEIWWSSPISGPKRYRYDLIAETWVNTLDGHKMKDLLSKEMQELLSS